MGTNKDVEGYLTCKGDVIISEMFWAFFNRKAAN